MRKIRPEERKDWWVGNKKTFLELSKIRRRAGPLCRAPPCRCTPFISRNLPSVREKQLFRMPGSSIRAASTHFCHLEAFSEKHGNKKHDKCQMKSELLRSLTLIEKYYKLPLRSTLNFTEFLVFTKTDEIPPKDSQAESSWKCTKAAHLGAV